LIKKFILKEFYKKNLKKKETVKFPANFERQKYLMEKRDRIFSEIEGFLYYQDFKQIEILQLSKKLYDCLTECCLLGDSNKKGLCTIFDKYIKSFKEFNRKESVLTQIRLPPKARLIADDSSLMEKKIAFFTLNIKFFFYSAAVRLLYCDKCTEDIRLLSPADIDELIETKYKKDDKLTRLGRENKLGTLFSNLSSDEKINLGKFIVMMKITLMITKNDKDVSMKIAARLGEGTEYKTGNYFNFIIFDLINLYIYSIYIQYILLLIFPLKIAFLIFYTKL
jgi:hypothetical protein